MTEIKTLEVGEHRLIGDVIGDSFADDPVNQWVFGSRKSMSQYYSLAAKKRHLPKGFGHITVDRSAGSLWLPPGTKKEIPLYRSLDIAASMVRYGSFKSLTRGVAIDSALSTFTPKPPHFYLFAIGTRPAEQGKGLGGEIMENGLALVDEASMPAYLESSKEINIPFYRRFGFEVTDKIIAKKDAPPLWLMWRDARLKTS